MVMRKENSDEEGGICFLWVGNHVSAGLNPKLK